jgi:diacylglycerol kinase (ATP)
MPDSFLKGRMRSVGIALRGLVSLFRSEPNMQVHALAALLVTGLGFLAELSPVEWILQNLAIGLVIGLEAINTSIEELANKVESRQDPQIKRVKDYGAAAVVFAAVIALITGGMLYIPRALSLIS